MAADGHFHSCAISRSQLPCFVETGKGIAHFHRYYGSEQVNLTTVMYLGAGCAGVAAAAAAGAAAAAAAGAAAVLAAAGAERAAATGVYSPRKALVWLWSPILADPFLRPTVSQPSSANDTPVREPIPCSLHLPQQIPLFVPSPQLKPQHQITRLQAPPSGNG